MTIIVVVIINMIIIGIIIIIIIITNVKEEDFDKVMDDIEAMVGDVSNQVNKSNDIIKIMEKKK